MRPTGVSTHIRQFVPSHNGISLTVRPSPRCSVLRYETTLRLSIVIANCSSYLVARAGFVRAFRSYEPRPFFLRQPLVASGNGQISWPEVAEFCACSANSSLYEWRLLPSVLYFSSDLQIDRKGARCHTDDFHIIWPNK